MRKEYFLIFAIGIVDISFAQTPPIQWQKALGGTGYEFVDIGKRRLQSADGGYIMVGYSNSNNGDVTANHGASDFWVTKLDALGTLQWQKSLGGSSVDEATSVQQTIDGGYIIAGSTTSNDGDVTGNHGDRDIWIIKLAATGTIEWQRTLGGTGNDAGYAIQQTNDGSFIVAGRTFSNNGDVSGNHGASDIWIIKLDGSGTMLWNKTFGGSVEDESKSIQQTSDGGYIVAGYTFSNNGDVLDNNGASDLWVIKLDAIGTLQWQKTFGGTSTDIATSIQQTSDAGFIVAGYTSSNNGDVSGSHGGLDYWVLKLDAIGTLQWQKTLGGTSTDIATSVHQTSDAGFIVAGQTDSNNGDIINNHGNTDVWIVKLEANGVLQWQKTLGGFSSEGAMAVEQTTDAGYIIAGYTSSNDGDVSGNHGSYDFWIIKLGPSNAITTDPIPSPQCRGITFYVSYTATGNYNPNNIFTAQLSDPAGSFSSPTDIGMVSSMISGTISVTIPISTSEGFRYRIRVIASDPTITGIDNGSNITINSPIQYFQDADADGYGNNAVTTLACSAPAGYVSNNTDCNDANNTIHPGATEICGNNIDDDCDGQTDEGCVTGNWYRSRQSGNWNNIATWEVSTNGGQGWANATVTPNSADGYITVRNTHTVTITAAITIDDVTVDAGGILTQRSNTTVNNGQGNDIVVNGTYNLENSGNVLGAGTVLINDVFNLIAGDIYVPFVLAPSADLNMNTGGAKTLRSLLTNNGTVNWSAGNLTLHSGTLTNNGVFNITNAVVVRLLNGTGTNLLSNSSSGIITKSGASNTFIVVPFNNNGNVQLNSGTLRIQGIYNNYNAVSFSAGAVLESFNLGVINFETGTSLSGTGTIYNNQNLNVNTAIDLPASVSFDCFGDLGGTSSLTVNGAFNWDNGDISCAVTIAAAGTLTITPGAKSLNALLTNNGTVNWINGNISFQNGTLDNYGSFNISNDDNLVNAAGTNLFTNNASGSVSKSSGGANSVAIPFANEGLIEGLGTITFSNIINNGVVAPGLSPGIITINSANNLFTANSELQIEINSASGAGSGHDQLRRAGNLALDGTLSVAETGAVPDGSYEIIRLTSGTISGSFSTLQLPAGYSLRIQNNNRVWLDKVSPLSAMPGNRSIAAQPERSNNKPAGKVSSPVLFPNPANQQVNILLPDELANGKISIQIIDQTGKMIKQWQAEQFNNKGRVISLNTATMHNGLYIVVIKDNKGRQVSKKVIIQH